MSTVAPYDPRAHGALCDSCPLRWKTPVPPKGAKDPRLVIVGEAPGRYDEKRGEPMIGPAGFKLDELLKAVGLKREQVWITNTILCRNELPDLDDDNPDKYSLNAYMAWLRRENVRLKKEAKENGTEYTPIASPIDCCAARLWAELFSFEKLAKERGQPNGIVVVPMGNYAAKTITGKQAGISKLRGSPIPIEVE